MKDIRILVYQSIRILIAGLLFTCYFSELSAASQTGEDLAHIEKLFLQGRYERVIYETDELIDARSRQRDQLYYLKGLSELKLNRFADARQSFEKILHKYTKSKILFDAHLGIGDSYLLEGDRDNAKKVYNEMLDKFSSDRNIQMVYERIKDCQDKTKPAYAAQDAAKRQFTIQVGCFKNRDNAQRLSRKLSNKGYKSYVEAPIDSTDGLYRVKVGRVSSKEEAQAIASKLNKDGYSTKICVNEI